MENIILEMIRDSAPITAVALYLLYIQSTTMKQVAKALNDLKTTLEIVKEKMD